MKNWICRLSRQPVYTVFIELIWLANAWFWAQQSLTVLLTAWQLCWIQSACHCHLWATLRWPRWLTGSNHSLITSFVVHVFAGDQDESQRLQPVCDVWAVPWCQGSLLWVVYPGEQVSGLWSYQDIQQVFVDCVVTSLRVSFGSLFLPPHTTIAQCLPMQSVCLSPSGIELATFGMWASSVHHWVFR